MKAVCIILIITLVCCISGEKGGLLVQVSQKGLDYVSKVALDTLISKTRSKQIEDVVKNDGYFNFQLRNIKIKNIAVSDPTIVLFKENQTISWRLNGASLAASLDWSWQYNTFITIRGSGSVDLFFRSLSVDFNFQLEHDPITGIPFIKPWRCRSEMDDLELDFSGRWTSYIYEFIAYLGKSHIKSNLLQALNQEVIRAIETNANNELKTLDVNPTVFDGMKIEFNLVKNPKIRDNSMEFLLSGCVYSPDKHSCPSNYGSMEKTVQNRMLAFSVSELSLNQILKVLYERGDFNKTITKNHLHELHKMLLQQTCSSGSCLGNFFSNVGTNYRNSEFELHFIPSTAPNVVINPTKASSILEATIELTIKGPGAQTSASSVAFKASIKIELGMEVENGLLKVKISSSTPDYHLSNLPIDELTKSNFFHLGNMVGQTLIDQFNKQADKGYPLVKTKNINLKETSINYEQNYIFLDTDFDYVAP